MTTTGVRRSVPTGDSKIARWQALVAEAEAGPLTEPSADEARNGWTAETLSAYLAEQTASQALRLDPGERGRNVIKDSQNKGLYRPHAWKGRR